MFDFLLGKFAENPELGVAGVPFETETVRSMRRVTRQPDGHWLVGDQVEAG